MPVQKFRNLDAARRALWRPSHAADLVLHIKSLWAFSTRLTPRQIPRGIRKFRSIQEANLEREQWVAHRVQTLLKQRSLLK
ncbi:MAG: hypothetical protein HY267_06480 [Deltaproteobacteria bacterium]|nr:hypothetical protein [Deltaproteobacteria bacterium]